MFEEDQSDKPYHGNEPWSNRESKWLNPRGIEFLRRWALSERAWFQSEREREKDEHYSLLFTCWPPGPRACRWLISSLSIQRRVCSESSPFSPRHTDWDEAVELFGTHCFFRRLNAHPWVSEVDSLDEEPTDLIGPATGSSDLHLGNSFS